MFIIISNMRLLSYFVHAKQNYNLRTAPGESTQFEFPISSLNYLFPIFALSLIFKQAGC